MRLDTPSPFATPSAELLALAATRPSREAGLCATCLATHHMRVVGHDGPHGLRESALGRATVHGWVASVGPLGAGPTPYRPDADPLNRNYTGAAGVGTTRGAR